MQCSLLDKIISLSQEQPDKAALAYKEEIISYATVYQKVVHVAGQLTRIGVCRGDRVLFSAVSKPEMIYVYLGIQYIGAIAVFLDKNATFETVKEIYSNSGATVFLSDKHYESFDLIKPISLKRVCEPCEEKAKRILPSDNTIAEIIYTSGTTGKPKGCVLTYRAVCNIISNTITGTDMKNSDVVLLPLPLNHSFALRVLRSCLFLGATVVLQNGFTFAKDIEHNIIRYNCSAMAIVPASVETIQRQMQDKFPSILGKLRYIEVSAGSLSPSQKRWIVEQLPQTTIINTWGSSESGGAIFLNVSEAVRKEGTCHKTSSIGRPLNNVEIGTVDEKGNFFVSQKGSPGRMAIKGDMIMKEYWGNVELSHKTVIDGWLLTNDLVYIDDDGYVFMLGRVDNIINVGGEKVSPVEVENVACEYKGISECACIGVPDTDSILGFVPVLFVVPKNQLYDESDLRLFLSSRLEKYKVPVKFIRLPELPKNTMQKTDKNELLNLWNNGCLHRAFSETLQVILSRHSVRRFSEKKIDRNTLNAILSAGFHAPSGHNMQTWIFTVISNDKEIEKLKVATKTAAKTSGVYFYGWENPSVVVLVSNDSRNPYGCQDASCAAENMMIAAWSFGIGSVWLNPLMTLREKSPVKELLDSYGIPEKHTVWSTLAMGYPLGDVPVLKKNPKVIKWVE